MPCSRAAAAASATPATESWSESASSSTPAAAARATTSEGGSAPSECVECDCRSNAGVSAVIDGLSFGLGRARGEPFAQPREGRTMSTGLIILIVVVVLLLHRRCS